MVRYHFSAFLQFSVKTFVWFFLLACLCGVILVRHLMHIFGLISLLIISSLLFLVTACYLFKCPILCASLLFNLLLNLETSVSATPKEYLQDICIEWDAHSFIRECFGLLLRPSAPFTMDEATMWLTMGVQAGGHLPWYQWDLVGTHVAPPLVSSYLLSWLLTVAASGLLACFCQPSDRCAFRLLLFLLLPPCALQFSLGFQWWQ